MKIYSVENARTGEPLAIFAHKDDAAAFKELVLSVAQTQITERTLFYGQPPNMGFNERRNRKEYKA